MVDSIVKITSDNENYSEWVGRELRITHSSNHGRGYDQSVYPQMLCDLADNETGEECPFALYEYEFEIIG